MLFRSDGYSGTIIVHPTQEHIQEYEAKHSAYLNYIKKHADIHALPSQTIDGKKVELAANLDSKDELEFSVLQGAEGIGLFRTENILVESDSLPDEEEQTALYKLVADRMYPHKVVVRVFDVGGDKIAPQTMEESNPFLGWRGIRVLLDDTNVFLLQLRAILRASVRKNLYILLPMISSVEEVYSAKKLIHQVKEELHSSKIRYDKNIQIGIMIEVPSAVILVEELAKEIGRAHV